MILNIRNTDNIKHTKEDMKMTLKEMRLEAAKLGIKGTSKMKKAELEDAIAQATAEMEKFSKNGEGEKIVENVVIVKAFTGMVIGEFEIVKQTKTKIGVVTKDGNKLIFNRMTGLQTNAKNPKFANRFEFI